MTAQDPVKLLRNAIAASGLSARRYARDVLIRDERTVRRWLKGDSPIPQSVVQFLEGQLKRDGGVNWLAVDWLGKNTDLG